MNIVIPCAGLGKRFKEAGFDTPKPLLDVYGKTMIERVVENFGDSENVRFIFGVLREHVERYKIDEYLKEVNPNCFVYIIEELSDGPLSTCYNAIEEIEKSEIGCVSNDELIIVNSDQLILDFDWKNFQKFLRIKEPHGVLGIFHSTHPKNSYVKINESGQITCVKEKDVISEFATNEFHYWAMGKDFIESSEEMFYTDDKVNGEFYVAPSFNYLIERGKSILPFFYNLHYPIGIPEDFKDFTDKVYKKWQW